MTSDNFHSERPSDRVNDDYQWARYRLKDEKEALGEYEHLTGKSVFGVYVVPVVLFVAALVVMRLIPPTQENVDGLQIGAFVFLHLLIAAMFVIVVLDFRHRRRDAPADIAKSKTCIEELEVEIAELGSEFHRAVAYEKLEKRRKEAKGRIVDAVLKADWDGTDLPAEVRDAIVTAKTVR